MKAENLGIMAKHGLPVPAFYLIEEPGQIKGMLKVIRREFPEHTLFAVRSSADGEDGMHMSFAGQFETLLRVPFAGLEAAVRTVFGQTERAEYYSQARAQEHNFTMHVMVQEMIEADLSGVLFTANPQGILNECVIVAGRGTGDSVVADKVPVTTCYFHRTDRIYYCTADEGAPSLTAKLVIRLVEYGEQIEALFGGLPQDIEFAVSGEQIFILQSRPVTTLDADAETIVLDNSNIVESYPGISLPATQSFVRQVYWQVFRSCTLRLSREQKTVDRLDGVLRHMVDVANGRIYYRISSWYEVLLMLPFSGKLIPVWQEMLGVQDKKVSHGLPAAGWITKGKILCSFFYLLVSCPAKMKRLNTEFAKVLADIRVDQIRDSRKLLSLYETLEKQLSAKWDITLVNDMYTFIYTALLKKFAGAEEANRILSRKTGLESMKPVEELIRIAVFVRENGYLDRMKQLTDEAAVVCFLQNEPEPGRMIYDYIELYGDRNLEELKLESRTFRTNPQLLIARIVEYAEDKAVICGKEPEDSEFVVPGGIIGFFSRRAAEGIRNREISRLNRSRIFGLVRSVLLKVGEELCDQQVLAEREDIFYLFFNEIYQAVEDKTSYQSEVERRKRRYQAYAGLPAYSRLVFSGSVVDKPAMAVGETELGQEGTVLAGIPCSGGIITGTVLVVEDPAAVTEDVAGKILVTGMTDPGWVFLITRAAGIIAEKGSLLSHTAIITRELKKPSVVGVRHAVRQLKTGDVVRMDGTTGEITRIKEQE